MKTTFTQFTLTCVFILLAFTGWAQQQSAKGKVTDASGTPIAFATASLIGSTNQVVYKSAVTDDAGSYSFSNISAGKYIIEVKNIGFETTRSAELSLHEGSTTLPTISLNPASTTLAEVEIQGKKPTIQRKSDMLVMNVEDTPLAAGNNALDILKQSPGVSVDNNENITLMGQGGVTVLIDGKQTFLSADQLNTLLKSTDGNSIKSIELITSPSSKYDAAGTAGIINIVLKKNKLEGTNGNFNVSAGAGRRFRGNTSLALNHKKENTNYFMSYSLDKTARENDINLLRVIRNKDRATYFDQKSTVNPDERTHSFRLGADHKTSERNTVGIVLGGSFNKEVNDNKSISHIGSRAGLVDSIAKSTNDFDATFNNLTLNINNQFAIDSTGRLLTADFDYSRYQTKRTANYNNSIELPDGTLVRAPELLRSPMPTEFNIYMAKVDYTHPINKTSKFESGLKYSHVTTDNDLTFESFLGNEWVNDPKRTNHFIYKEQVAAAYASYGNQLGKWGIQAGLRGEYTFSDGTSITLNNTVKRKYFDIFPNASVSYAGSENHILALSYSKRISRPNYKNLNPFDYFIDQFTFERGNPYLQPQYAHAVDLNYTLFKRYNFTVGYKKTLDEISETMGQDDELNLTWVTKSNLANSTFAYANFSAPLSFTKKWSGFVNLTSFYMHFKGEMSGLALDDGQLAFQGYLSQSYRFLPSTSVDVNARYTSSLKYSIYTIDSRYSFDLGLTHNFKDKRNSLKLAVTDIFKTNLNNLSTSFGNFDTKIRQYHDSRAFKLTYTYKFGNLNIRSKVKNLDTEEKDRVSK